MSDAAGQALEQALACHRAPSRLAAAQSRPPPEGMLVLLRLAAGDQAMLAECAQACGESEAVVAEAAAFFIQQVLFAPGASSYRMLGVNPDAPDDRIKEHYRWLVRWLHPDRNTDGWDSVYADRVNIAWQSLRTPERRRSYDEALAEALLPALSSVDVSLREPPLRAQPARHAAPEPPMLSPNTVEKLPAIVLGGLGGMAVALLMMMWLSAERPEVRMPRAVAGSAPQESVAALQAWSDSAQARSGASEATQASQALPVGDAPPLTAAMAVAPEPATARTEAPATATGLSTPRKPPTAAGPSGPMPLATVRARAPAAATLPAPAPKPTNRSAVAASPATEPVAESMPSPAADPAPVEPVATTAPALPPAASPAPTRLQEAQAHALLRRFSQAYQAGDIGALMRLFTQDARNNRGGRAAIAYDYQSLFSTTDTRELRLSPSGWMARDDGGTVLARYEAVVRAGGRPRADVTRGDIRFDVRLENGVAKISVVTHD